VPNFAALKNVFRFNFWKEKLKIQLNETDTVRRELKASKAKLEEEQKVRLKIEQQIDQHNEKAKPWLPSNVI